MKKDLRALEDLDLTFKIFWFGCEPLCLRAFEPPSLRAFEPSSLQAFEAFEPSNLQAFEPSSLWAFEPLSQARSISTQSDLTDKLDDDLAAAPTLEKRDSSAPIKVQMIDRELETNMIFEDRDFQN